MKKFKVTGKFRVMRGDQLVKEEIFINKIVTADNLNKAFEQAVVAMTRKLGKKYGPDIILEQAGNVKVKRMEN